MPRYHINPHTGEPGQCSAKINCPYGNLDTDHFNSPQEARAAYEAGNLDQAFTTLSKTLDSVVGPRVVQHAFRQEDGVVIHASQVEAGSLKPGERVWDPVEKKTYSVMRDDEGRMVMRARNGEDIVLEGEAGTGIEYRVDSVDRSQPDEALLAGIEKAGWPVFDPQKGEDQFKSMLQQAGEQQGAEFTHVTARGSMPVDDGSYHINGTDEPALTDETMQEMDEVLSGSDVRDFSSYYYEDNDEGEPVYAVSVSGYGAFKTTDPDIAGAAERLNSAGQWGEFEKWDEDPEAKLRAVRRYLDKPNALEYISDARLDNEDALAQLGDARDLSSESKRFRLRMDNAMLDIAAGTLIREAEVERNVKLFNAEGEPPF